MRQFWKRSVAFAVLSTSIVVGAGGVGVESADAAVPPTFSYPVFELAGKIQTTPFLNTNPPQTPGDFEGLAYDPDRQSMWLSDDSKFQLYEVEFVPGALATGRHRKTISRNQLAAARPFGDPNGPVAGINRAADLEALAFDPINDTLYSFAGSCCPAAIHQSAVFRLVRSNPGNPTSSLVVADYQPINAALDDFSGVGITAIGGVPQIWAATGKELYPYDYASNTFGVPVSLTSQLNGLGDINGVSFSDDYTQLWVTTSSERIIRLNWPGNPYATAPTITPGHIVDPRILGIPDTRAIEVVGSQVVVGDGYDFYPSHGTYEFALHVFNITNQVPLASFTAAPTTLGAGGVVTFQNTSTRRPTSLTWNFGDGSPPVTVPVPDVAPAGTVLPVPYLTPVQQHQYTTQGTYTATLVATNANGPSAVASQTITVTTAPAANFTMTPSSGAAPLLVQFNDASSGSPATGWSWDFGDGSPTTTAQNPSHTYGAPGTYTVAFTASNDNGASTVTQQLVVEGPPTADFTMDVTNGVAPLTVIFSDLSTGTPFITAWKWEFGDGGTSFEGDTSHTYEKGGQFTVKLTVTNARGTSVKTSTVTVLGSKFVGINPARLMDTRNAPTVDGLFRAEGPIGAGGIRSLRVVGRGTSVPADGIGAVALNVTAIGPSASSYVTVWPTGATRPNASNLNFTAGQTIPNMVIVSVGAGGQIDLFNESGNVDIAVDILGFFPVGPAFNGITPERFMDTRTGGRTIDSQFQASGPLAAATTNLKITGRGSVPASGVGSVALNVTVTNPTAESYLTVWPKGQDRPNASSLNYTASTTIPNMVIVPVSSSGEISLFNAAGSTDVIVDVLGWFPAGATASFKGLTPARMLDNRAGGATVDTLYQGGGALGAGQETTFKILTRGGVPASGIGSVALNVTVTGPSAESYLTVWPAGTPRPEASNLNFTPGTTIPNMVVVPVGPKGEIGLFNAAGSTNIIVDVLGYFPG